ncbi:MAG: phosphoenolpyruvate--protein phosphotransferase, partial [Kiritimatiellae bacterium]|nr:phosphoenolpyruvate--protein phosphotransferase [Kiritimatiellia bacterium]
PLRLRDGEEAILDCANETLVVRPDEERKRRFRNRRWDEAADRRAALGVSGRAVTRDGVAIALEANINILADLDDAVAANAEGIGLYRTEFPFLMRQTLPGEADQFAIYKRVLDGMPARPVTFRTLDAGGDKVLPYLYKTPEDNPALGLRSIRFSLRYPEIMDQQLRAMLRAVQAAGRDDVSVMFPMISSVEEFRAARDRLEACRATLRAEIGDRDIHDPYVGTMIEVPAALGEIDALAEEADFFSIGTNDLIQYLLAVDRTNAAVSASWVPHHPAVLKALKLVADAAARHSIPCSVCGEMARDPRYLPFLAGIGLRTISLEPRQIPKSRELVAGLSAARCEEYAAKLLSLPSATDIEAAMDDFSRETFGG